MWVRGVAVCGISLVLLVGCGLGLRAQIPVVPTAYTVTVRSSLFGPGTGQIVKTYRLGSKVLLDAVSAADATDPKAAHTRGLFDLETHRNLSWFWPDSSAGCSTGTFSGDWGNPFGSVDALAGQSTRQVGTETIHGFTAKVVEASSPNATMRAWVDAKTGLVLKAEVSEAGAAPRTIIEVKDVSFTPPASVFAIPANCAAEAAAPPPPTEAEQIAALTGGNPQEFVKAIYGPGSKNSCTMVFRVVKAGSMESISSGFQVAVDLDVATEPTPSYIIGMSPDGNATFSGGGLHEVTSRMLNGVLRIDDVPAQFYLETAFGNAGSSSTLIYRQCFAPQTVLLDVVKNPAKLSDGGEFLWVKSGKYAAAAH